MKVGAERVEPSIISEESFPDGLGRGGKRTGGASVFAGKEAGASEPGEEGRKRAAQNEENRKLGG